MKTTHTKKVICTGLSLIYLALPSLGAPAPNELPSGFSSPTGATYTQSGNTGTVTSSTSKAITNFDTLNVGSNATFQSILPDANSVILHRVTGGSASEIYGRFLSNGHVFLVNPNGILFGSTAQVSVGSLFASTLGINDQDFLSGNLVFNQTGANPASVINLGSITTNGGGSVSLVGSAVSNGGNISTPAGKVLLAAGDKVTVTLDNNVVVDVVVDQPLLEGVQGVSQAILNTGNINAGGGLIKAKAELLNNVYDKAVNNEGTLTATSFENNNGTVELIAKGSGANSSIYNSGLIEANKIVLTADEDIMISDNSAEVKTLLKSSQDYMAINSSRGNVFVEDQIVNSENGFIDIVAAKNLKIGDLSPQQDNLINVTDQGHIFLSGEAVNISDIATTQSGSISVNSSKINVSGGLGTESGNINLEARKLRSFSLLGTYSGIPISDNVVFQLNNTGSIVSLEGDVNIGARSFFDLTNSTISSNNEISSLSINQEVKVLNDGIILAGRDLNVNALSNLDYRGGTESSSLMNNLSSSNTVQFQNNGIIAAARDINTIASTNLTVEAGSQLAASDGNNLSVSNTVQVQNTGLVIAGNNINTLIGANLTVGAGSQVATGAGTNDLSATNTVQVQNNGLVIAGDSIMTSTGANLTLERDGQIAAGTGSNDLSAINTVQVQNDGLVIAGNTLMDLNSSQIDLGVGSTISGEKTSLTAQTWVQTNGNEIYSLYEPIDSEFANVNINGVITSPIIQVDTYPNQ